MNPPFNIVLMLLYDFSQIRSNKNIILSTLLERVLTPPKNNFTLNLLI